MVPPAPAPADHADPPWLTRIQNILHLSKGGVVVGLEGAHLACAGPLIGQLLEGSADVRVCFSGRELLAAPEGSRLVLLHAARDAELLNLVRPVVAERRLRVFVWLQSGDRSELSRRSRDFLDWMQLTIDVPSFAPRYAMAALERGLDGGASLVWEGQSLEELVPEIARLRPGVDEDEALAAMRRGPVVICNARGMTEVDRFEALHHAAGQGFAMIWEGPNVLPERSTRIIAYPLDWEVASAWLDGAGVREPRIEAAKLDLDPVAVSYRAGREPPPLLASGPESQSFAVSVMGPRPEPLREYFPAGLVTLTAELDSNDQLVLRKQGIPLSLHGDRLEIIDDPSSLPVEVEIRDFDSGGTHWTVEAHHGDRVWEREPTGCRSRWVETEEVEVVVVATSASGPRSQARSFFLTITPIAP